MKFCHISAVFFFLWVYLLPEDNFRYVKLRNHDLSGAEEEFVFLPWSSLVTNVFFFPRFARAADDVATPDELAFALLFHVFDPSLIASTAAQKRTTV